MLQQTQVKTVLPYWERWMKRLPTIDALAAADSATIHKLWEGLGYYTRVRNMQRAAQRIVQEFQGRFPSELEAVLSLPGVGRYTGGAICSIAYNQPQPILDGNVVRVLTRAYGIEGNVREPDIRNALWRLAADIVGHAQSAPGVGCSHLNQALMELGALVCTPTTPACPICPLRQTCIAYRENKVDKIPNLPARVASTPRSFLALVIEKNGRYLVRQRPDGIVNAFLWEFPNVEREPRPRKNRARSHSNNELMQATALARGMGLKIGDCEPLCVIKHTITRYRITLEAYAAKSLGRLGGTTPGVWRSPAELEALPFTSAHGKIRAVALSQKATSAR